MVFDEIDAGIGGQTAHAVGETLRRLGERAQVITITHLPQIASVAERHFSVEKIPGDPTHTRIEQLGGRPAAGGAPAHARRPGVPADRGMSTLRTFVEHTGPARLDRRTKNLVRRLEPDDVAIIDHTDLDRVSAEELLESGVRVVVNVASSQTGRFPNPGPLLLVRGGVRLIDAPDAELFDQVSDGELLTVRGGSIFRNGTCLVSGRALEAEELAEDACGAAARGDRGARGVRRQHDALPARGRAFPHRGDRLSRRCGPGSATATRSSSPAGPATSATFRSSARTSGTSSPCSSASTAGRTRSSRPDTSRT